MLKKIFKKFFPDRFAAYFSKLDKNKLDKELVNITETFINSSSYKLVSNLWHINNIKDFKTISESNLDNLGTKLFNTYFNFFYYENEYLVNLYKNLSETDFVLSSSNMFKKHNGLNYKQSSNYNYLLLLLYYNLRKSDYFQFLGLLKDETYLGFNNPYLTIENKNISSDKIISLFDLKNIEEFTNINNSNILEIGAGSGRLSECIMSVRKTFSYTICDIPPAIFISYKRLKLAFPNKKIKLLIDIKDEKKLSEEILKHDISFIFPHQISKLNSNLFNLTIAVDCFHEMDHSTINFYFKNITKLSKKLYFSIWSKTKNWHSRGFFKKTERLDFEKEDYPIPQNWKLKYKKNLIFPSNYISLGYILKE